jgi:DNA-directed RNA polymerase subunit RPC12/RpoP
MEKTQNTPKHNPRTDVDTANIQNYSCDTCGQTFQQPVHAIITVNNHSEGYRACPRCLSKVETDNNGDQEDAAETSQTQLTDTLPENCTHQFGYLKNRVKTEPFPEECLTCRKMIECMYA